MRKIKPSFQSPLRPWSKEAIEENKKIKTDYGLRRKKEILRAENILRNYRTLARELAAKRDKEKEMVLVNKLKKLGLLNQEKASLDDVLALSVENILDRRLQTIIVKKGLARTPLQARQFIVHGHVALDGKKIKWPSTLITSEQEAKISFYARSAVKVNMLKKLEEKPAEKVEEVKGEVNGGNKTA